MKKVPKKHHYKFDKDFIESDSYSVITKDRKSISGNPHLQNLDIRDDLWVDNPDHQYNGYFESVHYECDQCRESYTPQNGECVFDPDS